MSRSFSLAFGAALALAGGESSGQMMEQSGAPAPSAAGAAAASPGVASPAGAAPAPRTTVPAATETHVTAPERPAEAPRLEGAGSGVQPVKVAASPHAINFGKLWNGDAVIRKNFSIARVPRAGSITATTSHSDAFRIVQLRVWGDPVRGASVGEAVASPALRGGSGMASSPEAMTRAPRSSTTPAPSPEASGTASTAAHAGKVLKASLMAAPFTTGVAENDEVVVTVAFAPGLQEDRGAKFGRATVNGFQWRSEVALAGYYYGLQPRLAISVEPQTLFAIPGGDGIRPVPLWPASALRITNATDETQQVLVHVEQNAADVGVGASSYAVGGGGTLNPPNALHWTWPKDPTGDHKVIASAAGVTVSATFHVEYLLPTKRFVADGSGWRADVLVQANGDVTYELVCATEGMQFVHDCAFSIARNGQELVKVNLRSTSTGGPDLRRWTPTHGLTPDRVFDWSQSTWTVRESDGGDPREQPPILMR